MPETVRPSKVALLEVAERLDVVREGLRDYKKCLDAKDPNRGRIDEARDYLEAAAGRLKRAI
jgi:hypothetical protein